MIARLSNIIYLVKKRFMVKLYYRFVLQILMNDIAICSEKSYGLITLYGIVTWTGVAQ